MKNRIFYTLAVLSLFSPKLFAGIHEGGSTVGNGGDAIETATGWRSFDSLEYQNEFLPNEQAAYKTVIQLRLSDLASKLPKTSEFLRNAFENDHQLRWYFASYKLVEINDQGNSPVDLTFFYKRQLAINTGKEVFIQETIWKQLPDEDRAFVLVHEILWNALKAGQTFPSGEVVRELTGRILSKYNYQFSPKELGAEFRDIIKNPSTLLGNVVEADLQAIRQADNIPVNPAQGLSSFEKVCMAGDGSRVDDTIRIMLSQATGTRALSHQACQDTYRYFLHADSVNFEGQWVGSLEPLLYFQNIEGLNLKGAHLLSQDDLSVVAKLQNLKKLDLSQNKLTDVGALRANSKLTDLILDENLIESLKNLNMPSLQKLSIGKNFLNADAFKQLPAFPALSILDVSGNTVGDMSTVDLSKMPNLKELHLGANNFKQIAQIKAGDHLRALYLDHNYLFAMPDLSYLKQLDSLYVSSNQLESLGAVYLPDSLSLLDVSGNKIQSIVIDGKLNQLKSLVLSNNPASGIFSLKNALNEVMEFHLCGTNISSVDFQNSLKKAAIIDLSNNKIEKITLEDPPEQQSPTLNELHLGHNKLAGSIDVLASPWFAYLQNLDLSYNGISRLDVLAKLLYLKKLDLSGNDELSRFDVSVENVLSRFFPLRSAWNLEELDAPSSNGNYLASTLVNQYYSAYNLYHLTQTHKNSWGQDIKLNIR